MNEYIKKLLSKLNDDGIATGLCGNGDRLFAISKNKLQELLTQLESSGNEAAIILIQNPNRIN